MDIDWQDFIAGWCAGVCSLSASHPFDTIKVHQQVLHGNLFFTINRIFHEEGLRAFYKGCYAPMLALGPSNAVFFGVYGTAIKFIQQSKDSKVIFTNPDWMQKVLWAGTIAGICQVFVTTPAEVVKTAMQIHSEKRQMFHFPHYKRFPITRKMLFILQSVYRKRGISGVYAGCVPTIWRDAPLSGVYILCYEFLIDHHYTLEVMNNESFKQVVAGGCAGVVSWLPVMPFDVVKSKIVADSFNTHKLYNGMNDCFRKIYMEYGFRIFFQGTTAVMTRAFLSNAIMFLSYEHILKLLL